MLARGIDPDLYTAKETATKKSDGIAALTHAAARTLPVARGLAQNLRSAFRQRFEPDDDTIISHSRSGRFIATGNCRVDDAKRGETRDATAPDVIGARSGQQGSAIMGFS